MEIKTAEDAVYAYKSFDDWQYADREAAWKWMFEQGILAGCEQCAEIADARAMRCEAKIATAEDDNEVTELRSLAWQFSVLAAEMRKRSN